MTSSTFLFCNIATFVIASCLCATGALGEDMPKSPDRVNLYDGESVSEWVLTISSDDEKTPLDDLGDDIVIKRKDKIGNTLIYVVRSKDSKLSSALAEKSIDYDSFTKNYMVSAGPGDAKAYSVDTGSAIKQSNVVNQQQRQQSGSSRKSKRAFKEKEQPYFSLQNHVGNVDHLESDYECRTEPRTSHVGYDVGHFSWGIDRIDQRGPVLDRQACFFSTSFSPMHLDDDIVDVFVVDTGVQNDPSFVLPVSYDYSYYDADGAHASDCNGHATHVAGLIASTSYGVSPWNVQIRSIKALDCQGKGDFASLTAAFTWIKQNKSPTRRSIINLSLGSNGGQSSSVASLLQSLWVNDGVFSIAAAGNYGEGGCSVFPANVNDVIAVGALDIKDARAPFSNYGPCVDVFAPGVSIVSCDFQNPEGGTLLSGTSMSAPIVTGALANWMYVYGADMSPEEIKTSFFESFTMERINAFTISQDTPNAIVYVGASSDGGHDGFYFKSPPPSPLSQDEFLFSSSSSSSARTTLNTIAFALLGVFLFAAFPGRHDK